MSARFADFDNMVLEMMRDFGGVLTYRRVVSSAPNDTTGTVDVITEDIEIEAIKMELIRPTEGSGTKSNTLIQDGDQMLYVRPSEKISFFEDALLINPTGDRVIINGVPWKVVTYKSYDPSTTDNILYELYIRK